MKNLVIIFAIFLTTSQIFGAERQAVAANSNATYTSTTDKSLVATNDDEKAFLQAFDKLTERFNAKVKELNAK